MHYESCAILKQDDICKNQNTDQIEPALYG